MAKMTRPVTTAGNRTKNTAIRASESPRELATSMPGSIEALRRPCPPGGPAAAPRRRRARRSRSSAPLTHERDEAHGPVLGAFDAVARSAQDDQALVAVAHRRHEAAAVHELVEQLAGHRAVDGGGDVDRVVGRVL